MFAYVAYGSCLLQLDFGFGPFDSRGLGQGSYIHYLIYSSGQLYTCPVWERRKLRLRDVEGFRQGHQPVDMGASIQAQAWPEKALLAAVSTTCIRKTTVR